MKSFTPVPYQYFDSSPRLLQPYSPAYKWHTQLLVQHRLSMQSLRSCKGYEIENEPSHPNATNTQKSISLEILE